MSLKQLPEAKQYTANNRLRRTWKKIVRVLACVVVFCTTYALILPAITQESLPLCGLPEHIHGDGCYGPATQPEEEQSLSCALAEDESHSHTERCRGVWQLACGMEEHTHSLICHSDPAADLEDAAIWEASVSGAELTGDGNRDLVSVARTQLGYVESTKNYQVTEDGASIRGYTRYGAWYGDPYGDWNAMFASFCLHYAGVEKFPLESDPARWAAELDAAENGLFRRPADHTPGQGELVFLDTDGDGKSDRVGIIAAVSAGGDGVSLLEVIEGDLVNRVQVQFYPVDHEAVLGYAVLPVRLEQAEWTQVDEAIAMIDALPGADAVRQKLEEYAASGDSAREEAYYAEVSRQAAMAWQFYSNLTVEQRAAVTNAEKLLELEFLWSAAERPVGSGGIVSAAPVQAEASGTRDYIELNLYDYSDTAAKDGEGRPYPGTVRQEGAEAGSLAPLLAEGYPVLNDGESLAWLFDSREAGVTRKNNQWIDGLFRQDPVSGGYRYDSSLNHAQYDAADFDRDGDTDEFILFEQILTPDFLTAPYGSFLPLNSISDLTKVTQVKALEEPGGVKRYLEAVLEELRQAPEDAVRRQLITALTEYRDSWPREIGGRLVDWENLTASEAIGAGADPGVLERLYSMDWDAESDFSLGMEMKLSFLQTPDGYTGGDTNGDGSADYPMAFTFNGDADVWVYIDGVLFLDLTPFRQPVTATIDFVNGWVSYEAADGSPGIRHSFEALLRAAGRTQAQIDEALKPADSGGCRTFTDYTLHTLHFYAIGRDDSTGAFGLDFNLPLVKRNTIAVTKEAAAGETVGNPDYYFNILTADEALFAGPNAASGVETYRVMDSGGNVVKDADGADRIFRTDPYGIFTLKAGQTALFEGIDESSGAYFVQELIQAEDDTADWDRCVNGSLCPESQLVDWQYRTYYSGITQPDAASPMYTGPYGSRWYAVSGPHTDAGAGAAAFRFSQPEGTAPPEVGALAITQKLDGAGEGMTFRMEVTLDGMKLPVGTAYTLTHADGTVSERTVSEAGIISAAPEETAQIPDILSGTRFTIREVTDDYAVSYSASGDTETRIENDGVSLSGTVRTGDPVTVVVTNTEQGASLEIPVTLAFANAPAGGAYTCGFEMLRVTDAGGTTPAETEPMCASLTVTETGGGFRFAVSYRKQDLEALPAVFYYRITADAGEAYLPNSQQFVAEVLVTENGDGSITAELARIHGSDTGSADFVHTLAGRLILTNTVFGDPEAIGKTFDFTVHLVRRTVELPETCTVAITDAGGAVTVTELAPVDGDLALTGIGSGSVITITGLPADTRYVITESVPGFDPETDTDGFIITSTTGTELVRGATAMGTIIPGDTVVAYTNTQTYFLLETGGTGTIPYTMAGCMLMLYCATCLLYRYRKRRREASEFP